MGEGVRISVIERLIDTLANILSGFDLDGDNPALRVEEYKAQIHELEDQEIEFKKQPEKNDELLSVQAKKTRVEAELENYMRHNSKFFKAYDCIDELQGYVDEARNNNLKYVNGKDIQKRITELKKELTEINERSGVKDGNTTKLSKEIKKDQDELKRIQEKIDSGAYTRDDPLKPGEKDENNKKYLEKREQELSDYISKKQNKLKQYKNDNRKLSPEDRVRRREIKNQLKAFRELEKNREPFIDGNPIDRESEGLDNDQIARDIKRRTDDMLDKYYGNPQKAREYKRNWKELKKNIKEVEFEYTDKDGNVQTGKYKTVEEFEDMQSKLEMMQLQDYKEKLERVSKAEAGDVSIYPDTDEGKEQFEEDKFYVETYNASYNRVKNTKANLITLGKYGEKVPYNQLQTAQSVRNIFRAVGNVGKFIRNHTTAPINHFIGRFIVSPVYGLVAGSNRTVAGLYSDKATHRYVARREYFASQGDGYFKSRIKSIFKYKEGNKAVLSAGKREIEENAREVAAAREKRKEAIEQAEWEKASLDEKIEILNQDLENESDITKKASIQQKINTLKIAKVDIDKKRQEAELRWSATEKQNDAIDNRTHDIANKENVTRTITGVKVAAKAGLVLYGPKLSTWLANHKTIDQKEMVPVQVSKPTKQWVGPTYKEVPTTQTTGGFHGTLQEMMSGNAGKEVTGYYSVYGGEVAGKAYKLSGNDKITAVFQGVNHTKGTGLSDAAGLTNPVLTDRRFAEAFLDSNGVLKQNVSMDEVMNALGANTDMSTLDQLYFSVGDKYWVRASDLISPEKIVSGTKKVVDVPGHYITASKTVTEMKEVIKKVPNPRVVKVLSRIGKGGKVVGGAMLVDDIYENVRKTDSKAKRTKSEDRNYKDSGEFTGTKKDYKEHKKEYKKQLKEAKKRRKEEREEEER